LSKENVSHVVSSDSNSGNLGSGSSETLEGLYQALPKRRKIAPVDPFEPISISRPKSKKLRGSTSSEQFIDTAQLFDESPYFLTHEDLEPTEKPLIPFDNGRSERVHSRNIVLPKIPSRIRWDEIRSLYGDFFDFLDSP
jgi:hypothetical protein